jgi:hypothetical protein
MRTPMQREKEYRMHTDRIDQIMNGRKMGDLPLADQMEIFRLGMECIAMEMGAAVGATVHLKPKHVDVGQPFDCEHFADGQWHKVTIARNTYDYYKPVGEYPYKMEAFFANLSDPKQFRNFIYAR